VEAKGTGEGGRDFIMVLRCHMQYGGKLTSDAMRDCVSIGLINANAILQLVAQAKFVNSLQFEPLDMAERPILSQYCVQMQDTSEYQLLMKGGNNEHCTA
jgi:hypothetical protein